MGVHIGMEAGMEQSLDAAVPHDPDLHRLLDRALFRFESAALVVLLLITLVQPTRSAILRSTNVPNSTRGM